MSHFEKNFNVFQIIDPHYETDILQQPENRLLKMFYNASKQINMSMGIRHLIFVAIVALVARIIVIIIITIIINITTPPPSRSP